ncbi:hypothetical protein PV328_011433 [Microctonus aethiopoides]|nr:hypothetical protein PV328_011433 [Microctonus aethiopoides]
MDRLRRSFRDSFRRRKDSHIPESSKPHQWQADESAVRSATCTFHVKYLGCVEVFESRGMQVCEEALKVLRNSRKRPVRAILHVSGDGLRVVEDETKGLIVDQTIEKVSFCAPDRNHEKGFSYICRDGTTRRWMCHGFLALRESGERLSHAVGCAFAACLERKQRRDKECGVTMTFDSKTSTFTRSGSFRQPSLTEQFYDTRERSVDAPPLKQVYNPFAIERPHATPSMLERQGSFRGFNQLNQASPFKRQLSLRVNDLPSNLERTRSHSLEPTDLTRMPQTLPQNTPLKPPVSPIPEVSPSGQDSVSAMCQQLSHGLSLLSSNDDFGPLPSHSTQNPVVKQLFASETQAQVVNSIDSLDEKNNSSGGSINNETNNNNNNNFNNNGNNIHSNSNNNNNSLDGLDLSMNTSQCDVTTTWQETQSPILSNHHHRITPILNASCKLSPILAKINNTTPTTSRTDIIRPFDTSSSTISNASTSSLTSSGNQMSMNTIINDSPSVSGFINSQTIETKSEFISDALKTDINVKQAQSVTGDTSILPKPEQWLGTVTGSVVKPPIQSSSSSTSVVPPQPMPRRAPPLHSRALSLGSSVMTTTHPRSAATTDPFDVEWAEIAARNLRQSNATNPFIVPNTTQAFHVQL